MASLESHIAAIRLYVKAGIEPGGCTRAILENDLFGACSKADLTTRYILFDIVQWIYNNAPYQCKGSPEKVSAWIKKGGLRKLEDQERLETE